MCFEELLLSDMVQDVDAPETKNAALILQGLQAHCKTQSSEQWKWSQNGLPYGRCNHVHLGESLEEHLFKLGASSQRWGVSPKCRKKKGGPDTGSRMNKSLEIRGRRYHWANVFGRERMSGSRQGSGGGGGKDWVGEWSKSVEGFEHPWSLSWNNENLQSKIIWHCLQVNEIAGRGAIRILWHWLRLFNQHQN